jgi:putative phosphotransacetylase
MKIKIEVSARHIHLNKQDLEILFGEGHELEIDKHISQPGQYASTDTLKLETEKGAIEAIKVLGPIRDLTQIEISKTDAYKLGINAPLRISGKVIGSGGGKLIGPAGELEIEDGVIVAKRHIHMNPEQAHKAGVSNGSFIDVEIEGPRAIIFKEVEVRVHEDFESAMHIDTDEANAIWIDKHGEGILKVN